MADTSDIFATVDSHFTLHLLAPDEADVPPEGGDETATVLPENLVEDFVDEIDDMLDEIGDLYADLPGYDKALAYGFTDGALAVSDGSWSSHEDSYFADSRNAEYADVDALIDQIAADFEGSRPWDEAAKGYIRVAVAQSKAESDRSLWAACAHAFIYGAEAAYDLEWKFVVTPAGNLLITDEDSISEAALAQIAATSGSGSLVDHLFNMLGIDAEELAAAIDENIGGDEDPVEAELLEVEDVDDGQQSPSQAN